MAIETSTKRAAGLMALVLLLTLLTTQARSACVDLNKEKTIDASGTLSRPIFPGPPNYEDVRQGDAPEPAYILKLRNPFCVSGDDFVADGQVIDRIHLVDDETTPHLRGLVEREVSVVGSDAYGGHTGHHRAPLVMGVVTAAPVTGAGEPENDGLATVQAFYLALETGDGRAASRNVIPAKRVKGPLSAERLSAFYSSLDVPLKLQGVERVSPATLRARYQLTARGGKACNGKAIVTVERVSELSLISGIRLLSGC